MTAQLRQTDQQAQDWEARVSLWVDGEEEVRPDELDTPYGRQVWDTYHLIGDVLRNEELAIKPSDLFYARLSRAIDNEPPIVAPRPVKKQGAFLRIGLSGLAMAAAVASVAWIALPYLSGSDVPAAAVLASAEDNTSMVQYFEAHRDIAGVSGVRHASFEVGR
ncbi:MAG: sigma-E factor negative regulatory protein [Alcaligenaceae bacterium]|nr:sigma-E factor negative regulatory protein [Alcaligenaceae bacterium]